MIETNLDREIDQNYARFRELLPQILPGHAGEFALMRNAAIAEYFQDLGSAVRAGEQRFDDGLYSVQEITDQPVDLGFFSHAVDTRLA